jgi:hypothetical protein
MQSTFVLTRSCVLAILKVTNKKTFLIRILINCGLFLKTLRLDSFLFPCRLSHNAANYVILHCFSKVRLKSRNSLRHPIFLFWLNKRIIIVIFLSKRLSTYMWRRIFVWIWDKIACSTSNSHILKSQMINKSGL